MSTRKTINRVLNPAKEMCPDKPGRVWTSYVLHAAEGISLTGGIGNFVGSASCHDEASSKSKVQERRSQITETKNKMNAFGDGIKNVFDYISPRLPHDFAADQDTTQTVSLKEMSGDIFEGFQFRGRHISEIEIQAGGVTVWQTVFKIPVNDSDRILPYDSYWPLLLAQYHDIVVRVQHHAGSPISVVEWWRDVTINKNTYLSSIHSIKGTLEGRPVNVLFMSGMIGVYPEITDGEY